MREKERKNGDGGVGVGGIPIFVKRTYHTTRYKYRDSVPMCTVSDSLVVRTVGYLTNISVSLLLYTTGG